MPTTSLDVALRMRRRIDSGEARRLRERAGLTTREIARRCDVDATAVSLWERSLRFPRGRNLRAYGRILDQLAALETEGGGDDAA